MILNNFRQKSYRVNTKKDNNKPRALTNRIGRTISQQDSGGCGGGGDMSSLHTMPIGGGIGALDPALKDFCLEIRLSHVFRTKAKPFTKPRLKEIIQLMPVVIRIAAYVRKLNSENKKSSIDFFSPLKCKQIYGVPLGGLGTGTIGRSFSGDFTRFQLVPGTYEHDTHEASLFTVSISKKSGTVYQQTLSTRRSRLKGLRAWNMAYCGDQATYYALYPEAWTVYELPGQQVTLTCHQVSPVIPHNYKDSALPVGLFNWTVENRNLEDIEFSLMFTWQAGSGSDKFDLTDVNSKPFTEYNSSNATVTGVTINQKLKNMPLEYVIAAKKTVNKIRESFFLIVDEGFKLG
jgi:non-lysosomal glucosylceramidase